MLSSSGPTARHGYLAVWDAANSREILVGGLDSGNIYRNDVYTLSLTSSGAIWVRITPSGTAPTARSHTNVVWDAANTRMIVFGGWTASGYFNDVWTLTFSGATSATWAQWFPSGTAPSARGWGGAVWDPTNSRMLFFGGYNGSYLNDLWSLSWASGSPVWSQPTTAGTPPGARSSHSTVWDPATSRMIVFGGNNGSSLAETYALNFAVNPPTWSQLASSSIARNDHTAVWDTVAGRMLVFGGSTGSTIRNDTQSFDGTSWTTLSPAGTLPGIRREMTATWDAANNRMVVAHGIQLNNNSYSDVQVLSFGSGTPTWSAPSVLSCETAPPTPVLSFPANGGIVAACGPTLTWSTGTVSGYTFSVLVNGQTVATGLTAKTYNLPTTTPLLTNGNTWQVVATGCPGATAASAVSTFDVTPVAVPTLASPANAASGYCSQTFQWNSLGSTSIAYDLQIGSGGSPTTVASNLAGTSYTLSDHDLLLNGTYTWQVVAHDCASTATSAPRTVTVDSTPPTPILTAPANAAGTTPTPTFTWTAAGAASDVTYTITVDGSPLVSGLTTTSYTVPTASKLSNASHTWNVKAIGCLAASATSASRTLTADGTAPNAFDLLTPADNVWMTGGSATLSWQGTSDTGSGLASYQASLSGPQSVVLPASLATSATWALGSVTSADFSSAAQLSNWTLENQWGLGTWGTHSALWSNPGSPGFYGNVWNYSATLNTPIVASATTTASYWIGYEIETNFDFGYFEVLPQGGSWTTLVTYTGTNAAGKTETVSLASYAGQTIQLRFRLKTDTANSPQLNWQGFAIDDFRVGNEVTEGLYSWNVVATDNVGNTRTSTSTRHIGVDRTGPAAPASMSPAANAQTSSTPNLSWTAATDSGSGVCGYAVTLDGSVIASGITATNVQISSALSSAAHTWSVVATDCVGNVGTSTATVTFNVDTTAPSVPTLLLPANFGYGTASPSFLWQASTDAGSGVCGYAVTVDGVSQSVGATTTLNWPAVLSAGTHQWTARAVDCVGNMSAAAPLRSFTLDTVAPGDVVIVTPVANAFVGPSNPNMTWTAATDDVGVTLYRLFVDGNTTASAGTPTLSVNLTTFMGSTGTSCIVVKAYDEAGNSSPGVSRCFTMDRIAPAVPTLVAPAAGGVTTAQPTLSWGATSDAGSGVCGYIPVLDGSNLPQVTTLTAVPSFTLSAGSHTWTARSVDCVGNESANATTRSFTVDVAGPTTPVLSLPANNTYTSNNKPAISWSPSTDALSAVCSYTVTVDGVDQFTSTSTTATLQTALSDGAHTWTVRARDCIGNFGAAAIPRTINIDTTGPAAVTITAPDEGAWLGTARPTITWLATTDSGSGLASYSYSMDGQTAVSTTGTSFVPTSDLSGGQHCVTVRPIDAVLNQGATTTRCFKVDITAPNVPGGLSPATGSFTGSTTPTLTWNGASDAGVGVCGYIPMVDGVALSQQVATTMTTAVLAGGSHTWTVRAVDCLGFQSAFATSQTFTIDLVPPSTPLLSGFTGGAFTTNTKPTLSWSTATDTLSGVCAYVITIDGVDRLQATTATSYAVPTTLTDGAHTWTVRARDCVGNDGSPASPGTFNVDTTGPAAANWLTPDEGAWVASARPTVTWQPAVDAGVGLGSYRIDIDSGIFVTLTAAATSFTALTDLAAGQHCVHLTALDSFGTAGLQSGRCFRVDVTAPTVPTGLAPSSGSYVGTARPTLTWNASTDGASGVCGYIPTLDNTALPLQTATTFIAPSDLSEGSHTWAVRAVDCAGNQSANTTLRSVIVDLTAPSVVSLTSPVGSTYVSSTKPTFTWSPSTDAGAGICSYRVTIDGNTTTVANTSTTLTPTTALTEGDHSWVVRAVDCAGNTSAQSATGNFSIDTTGPTAVTITAPGSEEWLGTATPTVTWSPATDSGAGVFSYGVRVDLGAVVTVSAPTTTLSLTTALSEGRHCVVVTGTDAVSNVGAAASRCFRIDLTAPSVPTGLTPLAGTFGVSTSPTLAWNASTDAGSGVCGYIPTLDGQDLDQQAGTTLVAGPLAEGAHTWSVRAVDCVGRASASTATSTFQIDLTPPGIPTLVSPVGGSFVATARPTLTWSGANDLGSGICGAVVTVDGVETTINTAASTFSPSGLLGEGQHSWTVRSVDCVGQQGVDAVTATFRVDTVGPSVVNVLTPADGLWIADVRPTIEWDDATDSGSGVASYSVAVDANLPTVLGEATTLFQPLADLGEGQHCVTVAAVDAAGNTGPSALRCFLVDVAGPSAPSGLSPNSGVFGAVASLTLSWSAATDTGSGVCGYLPTFNGVDLASQTPTSVIVPGAPLEGTYSWTVRAIDCVGHEGASAAAVSFRVDLSPPTPPTLLGPAGGTFTASNKPTLAWTSATDAVAGVCGYVVTLDGSDQAPIGAVNSYTVSSALPEGAHSWTVRAVDCVGNNSTAPTAASFAVDTSAPGTVTFTSPRDGSWLGSTRPTVSWTAAEDSGSGVTGYAVSLDSVAQPASSQTSFTPAVALAGGSHCVAVKSVDAAGNTGASATTCFRIDLTAPTTPGLLTPAAGALVGRTPLLNWSAATDSGSGICGYIPTVDSVDLPQQASIGAAAGANLAEGGHTWTVRAVDCVGNVGTAPSARAFVIDSTPPTTVTLLAPDEGSWTREALPTLNWVSTTDSGAGVCSYAVTVDGVTSTGLLPVRTAMTVVTALAEGTHTWSVVATDCVGNSSAPQAPPRQFFIDQTPPSEVTFTYPEAGSWIADRQPTLTWNAGQDFGSGLIGFIVNSPDGQTRLDGAATSFQSLQILGDGEHCLSVQSEDAVGNLSVGAADCFNVDQTPPSVPAPMSPSSGQFVGSAQPTFTWTAAVDAGAGVCGYKLSVDSLPAADVSGTSGLLVGALSEGLHSWSVSAVDCAGNAGSFSVPVFFRVDLTPPSEISFTTPEEGEWLGTQTPLLAWTQGQDFGSGIAGYVLTVDGSMSIPFGFGQTDYTLPNALGEGPHCAAIHGGDRAGHVTSDALRCFNIDITAPQPPTVISPAEGACLGETRPTFTWGAAADTLSGVASYSVKIDSTVAESNLPPDQTERQLLAAQSAGTHTWSVEAHDQAANVATSGIGSFSIDTTAPTCAVKSIALTSGGLEIRGISSDVGCAGVASVEVVVDDQPSFAASVGTNGTWTATWNSPPEGLSHIVCRVADRVGLQSTSPVVTHGTDPCLRPASCDPTTGSCDAPNPGASCDDGVACTTDDVCGQDGKCAGTPSTAVECAGAPDGGTTSTDGGAGDGGEIGQPQVSPPSCGCSGQGRADSLLPVLMMFVLALRRRRVGATL